MTDRDLLASIHTLQVRTAETVGDIKGRLHSIEADVAAIRVASASQGVAIGALQQSCASRGQVCSARMARQSEEIARLGGTVEEVEEVSEVLHVADLQRKTRWALLAKIAAAVVTAGGLAAAIASAVWR